MKLVRHSKDHSFVSKINNKPGKLREFCIKDIDGTRNRLTIFDSCRQIDVVQSGMVIAVTNLQTSKQPEKKPHFLQMQIRGTIRSVPDAVVKQFANIDDSDLR